MSYKAGKSIAVPKTLYSVLFYGSLFLVVVVLIVSTVYLYERDKSSKEMTEYIQTNNYFDPIEESDYVSDIYNNLKDVNQCSTLEEPYKEYCISHYYTQKSFEEENPGYCLQIPYDSKISCIVVYSLSHNKSYCHLLEDKKDIYLCEDILKI